MLAGLALAFLITAPVLAIFVAHVTDAAGMRELRAGAELRQVPATLQESASAGQAVSSGPGIPADGDSLALVPAEWESPSGRPRTGLIAVPTSLRAHARVTIWVTKTGRPAEPPPSRADLTERIELTAVGTVLGLAVLFSAAAAWVRVAANRRRMAGWERAWAATSPRWSQSS